ncbi:3-deoxy-manno-octulosonate cytidylyltransferase [Carnimonas bestiolae]|uniref:3-deoxy-manno-octulosonate cytidylyltransferase n=1 Tax=Carnimonas bestiolae TaxID=3402172 RepID=UPI003EDC3BCB
MSQRQGEAGGFVAVIPARYASSRLPGKPLEDIAGQTMIERVWRQALQSGAERVVIATEDQRIQRHAEALGAEVVLTSADHENGTSRLAEVVETLALPPATRVVNVQGDEPLLPPALIDVVAQSLAEHPEVAMATLAEPISEPDTLSRASVVKVVRDANGRALYFSRAPIPWQRDAWGDQGPQSSAAQAAFNSANASWLRHIGLYAYRASFLHEYAELPTAPLEALEQLEQLRALYHGYRIQVEVTDIEYPAGVDTPADLERVRHWLESRDE